MFSIPIISSCSPGLSTALQNFFAKSLQSISLIKVLFPLPETPVTHTNNPRGIFTSIFFRLNCFAPLIMIKVLLCFRTLGISILSFRDRYFPVSESGLYMTSSGDPTATTSPPWTPAPGPISTRQSEESIISSSCSMSITVFPMSLNLFSMTINLALSL